jgi:MFS family permease
MAKTETETHKEKRHLREARELVFRQEQLSSRKPKFYIFYLFLVISMAYIADEVASVITTQLQSNIVTEFFVNPLGVTYPLGLSYYQSLTLLCSVALVFIVIYKPLSDRFGRKPFLIINTFFIGVGFLIIFLSHSLAMFLVGSTVLSFFTSHDVQVVYLLECSPKSKRATTYSFSKAIAILGTLLIPVLRHFFMGDDSTAWRKIFLVPAIFCFVAAIFGLIFAKETDAYLVERISYLQSSDDEREEIRKKKHDSNDQGGLLEALRFAWSHKQLRFLLIASTLYLIPCVATTTYQSVMDKTGGMSMDAITYALYFYPLTNAGMTMLAGILSDKKGRKTASDVMSVCAILGYLLFFLSTYYSLRPWLIGLFAGMFVGSYWSGSDQITTVMLTESAPTNLRSSTLTLQGVFQVVSNLLGFGIAAIVQVWLPEKFLGLLYLCLAIPGMTGSLYVLHKAVGETSQVDLDTIQGKEWDDKQSEPNANEKAL